MPEETDYEQLLKDLVEERADIDRMIAWVQKRLGQGPDSVESNVQSPKPASTVPMRFPRLAPDTFFRMSVPQAIKTLLSIVKRPKSAKEITAALDNGGLTHQAKNLYATVYPTLMRMERAGEVVRVGKGEWGLSEWYPSGRKASGEKQSEPESGQG